MNTPAPDQKIREIALDTSQSFILEAPAGSGKTALLTARFLALLAQVSHPRQIMAVTFTRKAAAEMADRIIHVLRRVQESPEDTDDSWEAQLNSLARKAMERHRERPELLKNPETFQVMTFHSFCASLTRAWPFESELPPGLGILEDMDQELLLEQAVAQYLNDLLLGRVSPEEREAGERRLALVNNRLSIFSGQLKALLQKRERLKELLKLFTSPKHVILDELHIRLEQLASLYLEDLHDYFIRHEQEWRTLRSALIEGGGSYGEVMPDSVPGTALADVPAWKNIAQVFLTTSGTPRKSLSGDGFPQGFTKHPDGRFIKVLPLMVARLLYFVQGWPEHTGDSIGLEGLADTVRLIGGVLSRFRQLLHERGLDYVELELAALRALDNTEQPGESLIFYHEHLRHILVDEAQDLNDIQVKILGKLIEGWEPGDRRTVFFVGDPKQSIYRFRRAEVNLFYELQREGLPREDELPLPLKPLLLTANFRSRPHLVEFANQLFSGVMASPREKYDEVRFAPSAPAREEPDSALPVTVAVFHQEKDSLDDSLSSHGPKDGIQRETWNLRLETPILTPLEREANWVAASVKKLHGERSDDTIAILIPVRTHLSPYIEALNALNVPVRLMEGIPLLNMPEVRHLLNLLSALVRPYDDVAWAGALRAPWLSVSNQVLCNLVSGKGLWSRRILSGQEDSPEVKKFAGAVEDARKMLGREPYSSTLVRLWEDLDGAQVTASRSGAAGVSNARKFLDLLDRCSGLPGEEALAKIQRLLESSYTPPDPRGAFSPVQMMTIHKAKGLEFDHVFAVNLNYEPLSGGRKEPPAYRVERLPGKEKHLLIAAMGDRRTDEDNLAFCLLKDLEKQRALAETRRLFYVVGTRARESLTLTGCTRKDPAELTMEKEQKNPLDWFLRVYAEKRLTLPEFQFECNPPPPEVSGDEEEILPLSLTPPPFEAEPLPYRVLSPSRVEDETSLAVASGAEEEDEHARARGVVIHRILDTLARGGHHPEREAIASALVEEGIEREEASTMAEGILSEAVRAWEAPDFQAIRTDAAGLHSEWAIEDYDGEYSLRVGRVDLLVKTGDRWLIVDYKTGRPDADVESWVHAQVQHYHPQLTAYARMAARVMNVPEERVGWVILFTALPRLVWQK